MSKLNFSAGAVLLCCALASAGCRSHQKAAAAPAVAPPAVVEAPVVRVEAPTQDFIAPTSPEDDFGTDPAEATLLARQKGLLRDAFFAFDSSVLTSDAQQNLTSSAAWMRDHHQTFHLLVEGHCDERGTEAYNLALGDHRAWQAKEYLSALGVDGSLIQTISYGEERPFVNGHDEEAFAQNRRAHLVLTAAK